MKSGDAMCQFCRIPVAFVRTRVRGKQIPSPASNASELKVACVCNLAYAYIKLGSMDEAEEACFQVLHMRPANAKALFRRGQARLALGRPIEAALDFSEVCLLEPNSAEATRMLRRAQGGSDPTPLLVGHSPQKSDKSEAVVPTSKNGEEALHHETTRDSRSNKNMTVDVKPETTESRGDAEQNRVVESSEVSSAAPPSGSSFVVSG